MLIYNSKHEHIKRQNNFLKKVIFYIKRYIYFVAKTTIDVSSRILYQYTGMSALTLAPKKIKKLLQYCL